MIIYALGIAETAFLCGVSPQCVYRWHGGAMPSLASVWPLRHYLVDAPVPAGLAPIIADIEALPGRIRALHETTEEA